MSLHGQPYVRTLLGSNEVMALIDTGAAVSGICKDIVMKMGRWNCRKRSEITLLGVGNHPLESLGSIELTVKLADDPNFKTLVEFQILPNFAQKCILGHDFLRKNKFIISYEDDMRLYSVHKRVNVPLITYQLPPPHAIEIHAYAQFDSTKSDVVRDKRYVSMAGLNLRTQMTAGKPRDKTTSENTGKQHDWSQFEAFWKPTQQNVNHRHGHSHMSKNSQAPPTTNTSDSDFRRSSGRECAEKLNDGSKLKSFSGPIHQNTNRQPAHTLLPENMQAPPAINLNDSDYRQSNGRENDWSEFKAFWRPTQPKANQQPTHARVYENPQAPPVITENDSNPEQKGGHKNYWSEFEAFWKPNQPSKLISKDLPKPQRPQENMEVKSAESNPISAYKSVQKHPECQNQTQSPSNTEKATENACNYLINEHMIQPGNSEAGLNPATKPYIPPRTVYSGPSQPLDTGTQQIQLVNPANSTSISSSGDNASLLNNHKTVQGSASQRVVNPNLEESHRIQPSKDKIPLQVSMDSTSEVQTHGTKVNSNLANLTINMENAEVRKPENSSGRYTDFLITSEDLNLAGFSEISLNVKIPKVTWNVWRGTDLQLLPLSETPHGCVLVAKQLITVKRRLVPLTLINLSPSPITITKGEKLAKIEKLYEEGTEVLPWDEIITETRSLLASINTVEMLDEQSVKQQIEQIRQDHPWITELDIGDLTPTESLALHRVLARYHTVFSKHELDIGRAHIKQAKIELDTTTPINVKQYPLSPDNLGQLQKEVKKLEDLNVIRKSTSNFNSPTVLVRKKDGSYRLCIDYRKLNAHTKVIQHPLPTFDFTTRLLAHNKYFSGLDMVAGYFQISLSPESRPYTAFTAANNKYEFTALPMGLKNGVGLYQQVMNMVLGDMQFNRALVYVDDVLLYSRNFQHHLDSLIELFSKLEAVNLKLKPRKCGLFKKQISFLGHVIGEFGIRPDNAKIEAVQEFGTPTSKKQVKSFLGLCSYFRRFVPNFAQKAQCLFDLTSVKSKFEWSDKHQAAFITLKNDLVHPPVLAHPKFEKPFILYTDASLVGVAGILCQEHPDGGEVVIAYASKKLSDAQTRYTVTELELWALIYSVKQFRCYLHGAKWTAVTDHCPLRWLYNMRDPSARHFRWIMFLEQFQYEIRHRKGAAHTSVDALSRNPNFIDRSVQFRNPQVDLLKRVAVDEGEIFLWKKGVTDQLGLTRDATSAVMPCYEGPNCDSLFEILSLIFTNTTNYAPLFRDIIHKVEVRNRKYIELNNLKGTENEATHLRNLKKGAQAGVIELMAVASEFRIPIIYEVENSTRLMLGEMESKMIGGPPGGVILELARDKFDNWIWKNPKLTSSADEYRQQVWKRDKREKFNYPRELSDENERTTKNDPSGTLIPEITSTSNVHKPLPIQVNSVGLEFNDIARLKTILEEPSLDAALIAESPHYSVCSVQSKTKQTAADGPLYVPTVQELVEYQKRDKFCNDWTKYLQSNERGDLTRRGLKRYRSNMKINDQGILVYNSTSKARPEEPRRELIVLPKILFPAVMKGIHEFLAHPGRDKTAHLVMQRYFRPGLSVWVAKYVKSCTLCKNKSSVKTKSLNPIQRFPMPQARFVQWSLDIVGPLALTPRGNKVILTMVDGFSRWLEAVALPDSESETIARAIIEHIVARFGVPHYIHTDRGSNFLSELMTSVYNILGIRKTHGSPYHPESNGAIENAHKYIGNALRLKSNTAQTDWDLQLPYALLSYRTSFHKFTGDNPAWCIYGCDLQLPIYSMMPAEIPGSYAVGLTPAGTGAEVAHRLSLARERFLAVMEKQTAQTHARANKDRDPVELKVGDGVLLKRPLTAKGKSRKLHKPYVGPFKIIRQLGDATFIVKTEGGRKQYRAHANNLLKNDIEFRKDVELWASQAEEVLQDLKTMEEVTPPLMKPAPGPHDQQQVEISAGDALDDKSDQDPETVRAPSQNTPPNPKWGAKEHFTRSKGRVTGSSQA